MSTVHVICFSKDRPLQLHGYLTSLFACWYWPAGSNVQVSVLVRLQSPYRDAYEQVYSAFPQVGFWEETDFGADLAGILDGMTGAGGGADYTCFGCDDVVFVHPFQVGRVLEAFREQPDLLGYSLRLGRNIKRNFLVGEIPQPVWLGAAPEWQQDGPLIWDASAPTSRSDWGYPWEVMGTVYRTEYVREMVEALTKAGQCASPSQLEHYGSLCWMAHMPHRLLAAPWQSALVLPVVNRVQHEFPNSGFGVPDLSPEFLLGCWEARLRLDTERFGQRVYDAMHIPDFFLRRAG